MAPSNKYGNKPHPLGLSRETSNIFDNPKQRDNAHRLAQGEVFTPKHDLSMISGGAPGNVNEEESINLGKIDANFDLDDMRNSLMDFKTGGPP